VPGAVFSPNKPKHYQRYSERIKSKRRNGGSYATTINQRNESYLQSLPEEERIDAINAFRKRYIK
jgi:hypothetical protein